MDRVPTSWWEALWEERGRVVYSVLGETREPGMVLPYSWEEFILPGACCLTFGPGDDREHYLYMTLGMTQPLERGGPSVLWEFAVRSNDYSVWPTQLLFDLLTYWLTDRDAVSPGLYLPLVFFRDRVGTICAGLTDTHGGLEIVGPIRGLYLWEDHARFRFPVSSGDFGLLTAVAVTEEEDQLAQGTTPPHLLLLLKEMGIDQVSDPFRQSVMQLPDAGRRWERIKSLSHDDAVRELQWSGG